MTLLTYGLQSGWISPMTKVLQADVSPLDRPLSDAEVSWVASAMSLAAVFGVSIYAYIADAYGRRVGIVAIAIPQALCWILKLSTTSTSGLVIARICCGIPAGGCFNLIPMYVKEISRDNIRGLLGSLLILMQNIGILAMYAMGSYLEYRTVLWLVLGIPILTAVLMLKAPESPAYLVNIGKIHEATRTIAFLRGLEVHDKSVQNEISAMMSRRAWRRALLRSAALVTAGACNGCFAVVTAAAAVLAASGAAVSAELQALSFPAVMTLASFASICCVEKVGRRVILSTCYIVTVASQLCLATCQLAQYQGVRTPGWLPVLSIITALCAYSAGVAPMPYIMMSEMFHFQIRAKAMGFIVTYAWLVSFVQLSLYAWSSAAYGMHVTFYGFAGVNLLGLVVVWYLPETRGKTVQEIEDELS